MENLSQLKKERSQLRRFFTKACRDIDALLQSKETTQQVVLSRLKQLEDKGNRLFILDDHVTKILLAQDIGDDEIDQEFDAAESYRDTLISYQTKCDLHFATITSVSVPKQLESGNNSDAESSRNESISSKRIGRKFRLPKLELNRFDGNVRSWIGFWGQFRKIHDDKDIEDDDKFQYLLQAMEPGTAARDLVESFPPSGMNYEKAIDQLKTRFARDGFLIEVYVRELLSLVLKQATQKSDFLRTEVESEERINLARTSFLPEKESKISKTNMISSKKKIVGADETELYTAASLHTSGGMSKKIFLCSFCDKSHASQDCIKAQSFSLEERKEILKKNNSCYACLRRNHNVTKCRNFVKCLFCGKKHFPIMCPDLFNKKDVGQKTNENKNPHLENALMSSNSTETLLQTLNVRISNGSKSKIIRVLLDSGSQKSYILTNCATEMNLREVGRETIIQSVFGGQNLAPQVHKVYEVNIQNMINDMTYKFSIMEQNKICGYVPRLQNTSCLNILREKNIFISDFGPNPPVISLLLGADILCSIITGTIEKLENSLVAMETDLGWVLMGQQNQSTCLISLAFFNNVSISNLWSLDILGIHDPADSKTKEALGAEVLREFNDTISCNSDGRYEVRLSWVQGHPTLSNNEEMAKKRLLSTTKKLLSINKFNEYDQVFNEWLKLGIIEEVFMKDKPSIQYYLPHHPVIKENSATTKIRPVFEANSKDKNGFSLNECLNSGPNMIEMIPQLILRFRIGLIGVIADIKKAFLQISLDENDRNYLAFLWWKNNEQKLQKIYRHCRVVFGVTISPFLLSATIQYHLEQVSTNFHSTANKLKKSFYVDNCITSVDDENELNAFINDAKYIMSLAQFDLRGWIYNSGGEHDDKILNDPDVSSEASSVFLLGMMWNIRDDSIYCKVDIGDLINENQITKRVLLSTAQKIFDPIGFTSPTTLIPKFLLQNTWKLKVGWDHKLPPEIVKSFNNWLKEIHWLKFCTMPRNLCPFPKPKDMKKLSLHVFVDSSKLAYAACVFLRTELNNSISVQLLLAKSRIAPMKPITLPRLELLAAVIGVRLCRAVKEVEEFTLLKTFYWSDSMVVLTWIKTKIAWNTFVGNRVKEIRSYSLVSDWNHVPGDINPADLPSRGCSPKALLKSKWWEGPSWLKEPANKWPSSEIICSQEELNMEKSKNTISIFIKNRNIFSTRFHYFSKFSKIIRMVGWMYRFKENCQRQHSHKGELTSDEVEKAEILLLKIIQQESLDNNLKECNEKLIAGFEVFRDENGLIRVKTRLVYSDDNDSFKYPILLPHKHELVSKLIEEQHGLSCHAGTQILLSILRQRFWILRGRKTIREVLLKCVVCKRYKQKALETPFAPLPANRIKSAAVFEVTGIDLAGPLYLKDNEKCWIVIFTCAIYRAVHFELVLSLSTDSFIMSLRRFFARRGRTSIIYSDNGTNFTGTNNHFQKIDWDQVVRFSNVKKIKWNFIPPTAAWWGGWWERIVRIVKELVRRNLGRASVHYEELLTLICDCEATINSRPLTYISEDSNDMIPLTPVMFLQDIGNSEVPDIDKIDRSHLVRRFRYLQKVREDLRKRFRSEYLAELVNTGRRKENRLQIGDIVLIGSDHVKRVDWPIGRILNIIPGHDKISRVACVKTKNSEIVRPLQRLFPLEITATEGDELKNKGNKTKSILVDRCSVSHGDAEKQKDAEKEKGADKGKDEDSERRTRSGRRVIKPEKFIP